MTNTLDSWSHSRLVTFEKCKFRSFLKDVSRIPEPERELREGQLEHANDRGSRIHAAAENFVKGLALQLSPELLNFRMEFEHLRRLYDCGLVSLEGEWGFDMEWEPCDWLHAWHRAKLDAIVMPDAYHAVVIDYKTGKRYGNEIKHGEQTQLYALDAVMLHHDLEEVKTELWYLDTNEIVTNIFTREQALRFRKSFQQRGMALTTCTDWPPNPSIFTCRYCDYGKSGHCKVSASEKFLKRKWR